MRKLVAAGRMIFLCLVIIVYLIIIGIPVLTYSKLVKNPTVGLRFAKNLDRILLFVAGLTYDVTGLDKLSPGRGYVYVGNHRSFVDVGVVYIVFPGNLSFLAKKELFKIPLVSFALRVLGVIEVDRSNSESAALSIERAVDELKSGRSIILFPEGTRSRSKGMLPFKKGAFVLAIKAHVPIVPFTLIGTDRLIKPDTIFLYPGHVKMIIHDPIETAGMDLDDRNELLEQAQKVVESTFLAYQQKEEASVGA
jgi:1-acyl-sn-glycerol-3-phosphate acyltransferase